VVRRLIAPLLIVLLFWGSALGWSWNNPWLVKINGVKYTKEDFVHWWENWRDENTPFPKTLEPFINWFLLFQEGERMRLFEDPTYRKKVRVFLEARTLMLLKAEEVDRKIRISQKEVKEIYEKDYVPLLHVRAVRFSDEKEARAFLKEAGKGGFENLVAEKFPKTDRRAFDWGWKRPYIFPASVRSGLVKMKEGEVMGPVKWMGKYWLLELVAKRGASEEDFKKVKGGIEKRLRRNQEGRLTLALIKRLKKKYHVWVDRELFESLDVEHPKKRVMDKPLLRMGKMELKVKDFIALVNRELNFRRKYKFPVRDMGKIKKMVMGNLISQTLTSWEAMNRHYERKPPFKWVFRFYCQHRIIRELEDQLFWPKVKVTEEDARKYYQEHIKEFELPPLVRVAMIQTGDEKLAGKMERALNRGEDFFDVARKYTFHSALVRRVPVDHLPKELKEVVSRLSPGEVGPPVKVGEFVYLVKLVDRVSERRRPFQQVKDAIVDKLRKEKFRRVKEKYIAELKKRSRIEVNERAWRRVRKELGKKYEEGKDDDKKAA